MEYKALYRKYRPQRFEDVVGQDAIVTILKNSILGNKIGHAYLFSGTRGTGKTSVAKIFSKTVNCINSTTGEKCGKCKNCKQMATNDVDIIEIDAASNNGVDEIREIRNNAKLLPNIGEYKIYIIDEVHMLSTGAFNALLKTLEEPPVHVIFILATTEIQKIPLTIMSRCQKFEFKKIGTEDIVKKLRYIAKAENINITKEALEVIASLSDGGLRDAINLLDQSSSENSDEITATDIYTISGVVSPERLDEFVDMVLQNNTKEVLNFIDNLGTAGKNYNMFCEGIIDILRTKLIKKSLDKSDNLTRKKLIILMKSIISLISELKLSLNQKILVEVNFLEVMNKIEEIDVPITSQVVTTEKPIEIAIPTPIKTEKKEEEIPVEEHKTQSLLDIRINNALASANKTILQQLRKQQNEIHNYISNKKYNTVANIMMNSILVLASEDYAIYEIKSKSSLATFKNNIELIEELLEKIYNKKYKVSCLLPEDWQTEKQKYLYNKKHDIKYEIIDEDTCKPDVIDETKTKLEQEAINIFGKEKIKSK